MERAGKESGFLILWLEVTHRCNPTGSSIPLWQQGCGTHPWGVHSLNNYMPWPHRKGYPFSDPSEKDTLSEKHVFSNFLPLPGITVSISLTPVSWIRVYESPKQANKNQCLLALFNLQVCSNLLNYVWEGNINIKTPTLQMGRVRLRAQLWATFQGHTIGGLERESIFCLQILCYQHWDMVFVMSWEMTEAGRPTWYFIIRNGLTSFTPTTGPKRQAHKWHLMLQLVAISTD